MVTRHLLSSSTMVVVLLTACVPESGRRPASSPRTDTRQDSLGSTWRLVYGYVRLIDQYARPQGTLPTTLGPVADQDPAGLRKDAWGRQLRYRPNGLRFEVRSAGSDGVFETTDDIVAFGQLGRNQPCEIRDPLRVWTGVGFEPPCTADSPVSVLPQCPAEINYRQSDDGIPASRADSIRMMGIRLVRIAWGVDGIGRDLGALPLSLRPIPSPDHITLQDIGDIWGRPLRYTPDAREFEVRSAGPDAQFETRDDIVVHGRLGQVNACEFRSEGGTVTCAVPPPTCPKAP